MSRPCGDCAGCGDRTPVEVETGKRRRVVPTWLVFGLSVAAGAAVTAGLVWYVCGGWPNVSLVVSRPVPDYLPDLHVDWEA
jgi:hypothetical protein